MTGQHTATPTDLTVLEEAWADDGDLRCDVQHFVDGGQPCHRPARWRCTAHGVAYLWCDRQHAHWAGVLADRTCGICHVQLLRHWTVMPL